MRDNITRGNMDDKMAAKWFPFIGALFLFIWFSNLIGFIPLPTAHEKFSLFGLEIPTFAIYAATANVSVPLVLSLIVFISYTTEGIRAKGVVGYLKSLIPAGVTGAMAGLHLRARAAVELHADHLALRASVRQHARRAPDHPVHGRRSGDPARHRRHRRVPAAARPRRSTCSRSASWPPCRRSSSPPCPRSTSAARSPSPTRRRSPQ